jgi:hypothetical protein
VVVGNTVVGSSGKIVGVVNVAVGTTMWLVVLGTTAGVLISSPGTISGESKEDIENDRGNPGVEKGLPLPLPPQNPYPRRG